MTGLYSSKILNPESQRNTEERTQMESDQRGQTMGATRDLNWNRCSERCHPDHWRNLNRVCAGGHTRVLCTTLAVFL